MTVTGSVDTSVPGDYEVTYTYTDAEGNVYTKTVTITVVASQESLEVEDQTLTQNETWDAEAGFTSGTDFDGNAIDFSKVVVSGDTVDTSKTGTYNVIYTYTDAEGNVISKTITVTVNAKDTTVTQADTWNAEDGFVSGTDADGNAISFDDVKVSGATVDISKTGTYNVTYTYTDKYGNEVSQTVKVTVAATTAMINAKDTTVTQGSTWNAEDGSVSGTDVDGNAISFADVKVSGDTVDTSKTGTYNVTYTYTDKYGNEVSQTITVTVTAKDTDTDNNGGTETTGDGDTINEGNTETTSDGDTINDGSDTNTTGNMVNANTSTNKNGSAVNAGYQTSATTAKTVKLNGKTKGTAVDQIAKGNLPQTDETTKSSTGLMGLVLLGFTGMLALAGVKRRRTDK